MCIVIKIFIELYSYIAQKMKFFIKDYFSKCDQIRNSLGIWSHLLKKSLTESFSFCAVLDNKPLTNVNPLPTGSTPGQLKYDRVGVIALILIYLISSTEIRLNHCIYLDFPRGVLNHRWVAASGTC